MSDNNDTYYNVSHGRLKLREGNIENALIYYEREDVAGSKASKVILYRHQPDEGLKSILAKTHGIKVVVRKRRRIYFIDNVKFHFDIVDELGEFLEVEAIDTDGSIGAKKLQEQADYYKHFLEVKEDDTIAESYSDMLMQKNKKVSR